MIRALVVEHDAGLRQTLEDVLHDTGFACASVNDMDLARAALQVSPYELIVLVGHGDPRDLDAPLLAEASALPRHAYLILSTRPDRAPQAYNPRTQRFIPVVAAPYDLDTLLTYLGEAQHLLDTARPTASQINADGLGALAAAEMRTPTGACSRM